MRQSKLLAKILYQAPQEAETISHRYLVRGGFIDQLMSGVYNLLPLGFRVYKKIEAIIREEMNMIGAQELLLPTLQPKKLWQESGRWETIDPPLFKLLDRHKKELALGSTHEEVITDLIRRLVKSYKDLPLGLYQIQNKFRNEMRSTGGLLRVREFIMKDLYSFHPSEADLLAYYKLVEKAYFNIFRRCSLEVVKIQASSGSIGGEMSHEFACLAPTGEDTVIICHDCDFAANIEINFKEKNCPKCHGPLTFKKAIENGHIFNLGTKYSTALGAYFVDQQGQKKPIIMGCYGIGLGRLMATVVEAHHDERGIIWPKRVAPYEVHLLALTQHKKIENLYEILQKNKIEVLYDDREEIRAGEKFTESDLLGLPLRLVISEKTLNEESGELKMRDQKELKLVKLSEIPTVIQKLLKN